MIKRVLTGMRTTGKLHLGHYVGALKNWKEIQDRGEHECFFLLADVQALTTHADNPKVLVESVRDVVLDWLSVGLDPTRPNVHFVLQSQVMGRYALSQLFLMIAGKNEVERNPTLKTELKQQDRDVTMGFMTYPVDQAADIYMVTPPPEKGNQLLVPVGEDQVPHLEYSRVLAQRFNQKYGSVFQPCGALVGQVGRLIGTDGQAKMSKSLNNAIYLSDDSATVQRKAMNMFTDPKRIRPDIPGNTDDSNPVFAYHRAFNSDTEEVTDLTNRYQQGKIGDVEVKQKLIKALELLLAPIRERRAQFANTDLREILIAGTETASKICNQVTQMAMDKMFLKYP